MNASEQTHPLHRYMPETLTGGSVTEGIGALGTIVLAILGLAGVFTSIVAPVATIVIGAVFLADSMLAKAAISTLSERGIRSGSSGMSASFFAGIAGIVLGILSFFHSAPLFLAVALLVYGGALLLSGGTLSRLSSLQGAESSELASSGNVFMGLAVTVLGILAVIGLAPITLSLVGLLCLGASAFFSGTGEAMRHAH